ncbi:hypothetical protein PWT90_10480 [Aphanocladium album]|nr:hypothetical protein PWT90_10480 [Aphanocladium album]
MSASQPAAPSERRVVSRSRLGCWTCRLKKVKCDEARPQCQRCCRLRRFCDYGSQIPFRNCVVAAGRISSAAERTIQLPPFASSACSITLTASDHEAIRYFRTTFAQRHHTKHPDYSVYSIIFSIAQYDQLVMHSLLALACRDIEASRLHSATRAQHNWSHLSHYSSALKQLTNELERGDPSHESFNFDVCFTALYIMMLYEQNFGDDQFLGLSHHLDGAAVLVHRWGSHIQRSLNALPATTPLAVCRRGTQRGLSLYSARILVWMSIADAAAATYGIGGTLNEALHQVVGTEESWGIERLHALSKPLFRVMWSKSYPQAELMDDVENRNTFELLVSCSHARHVLAQLSAAIRDGRVEQQKGHTQPAKIAIQRIAAEYSELFAVADRLLPETDSSRRLIANLRTIVPHYHAVVVEFERLTADRADRTSSIGFIDPTAHISSIMNLARQAYRHQGNDAMIRIAWPLFVVAMETTDKTVLDWILCRFQSLASVNKNLNAAETYLRTWAGKPDQTTAAWAGPGKWHFIT